MSCEVIGGIEGGASHTHAVLMSPEGQVLAVSQGPGTNHFLIGKDECRRRIVQLIDEAKTKAGIPVDAPLAAIGLSLSGCEVEESNQDLVNGLIASYPHLARQYSIASDTDGSIATTSNQGGVVCIAGTGSNTLLINPDGTKVQCGGWGYLLGDEGSAWSIASRAIKYCFDDIDKFQPAPAPTDRVWSLIKDFFKIKTQCDILDIFYKDFDKSRIALVCKSLSQLAKDGDALAQLIFEQAGRHLAASISAVASRAASELTNQSGGLHVLCVGSVWLSWNLLENGFISHLKSNSSLQELSLMRLKTEMGVGAALMASDRLKLRLDRDYSKNYTVFYSYKREDVCNCKEK
ncbi:N-acetylglucosamine kinase [Rhynchophorus ferrugineus]|uniref:N-acetylglucosamine kinase n=1 Tax=Rhynchophorus ferrugineus TaxID=354439 RepID=UPI003FCE20B5